MSTPPKTESRSRTRSVKISAPNSEHRRPSESPAGPAAAAAAASKDITLRPRETDTNFLNRLFAVMKKEMQTAAEHAPRQHLTAASAQHSSYTRSVLEKVEAIEECVTPRTRERWQEYETPESSASPQSLFRMAEAAGLPLRKVAALRAIFAGPLAEGIDETEFLEKFGSSMKGAETEEAKRFWLRALDRNSDGSLQANELFAFLTLATDVKASADVHGFFETGTFEQIPKVALSQTLMDPTGVQGGKVSSKERKKKGTVGMRSLSEQETLERQRKRRDYEEKFDANTRKILAQVTATAFERADVQAGGDGDKNDRSISTGGAGGTNQREAAAAAAAAAAALGGAIETWHHRGQIVRFFYITEMDRIFTVADDGLVLSWDPKTLTTDPKPVHRGPRPIVDAALHSGGSIFLLLQDDGCMLLYGVKEGRATDDEASVRLLGCYAPETLSSLERDADGRPAYPGLVKSRVLKTRLLPAVTIANFPKGASQFITAVEFLPPDPSHSDLLMLAGTQSGMVLFVRLTLSSSMHRTEVYHVMSPEPGCTLAPPKHLHGKQVVRVALLKGRHLFASVSLDGSLVVSDWERRSVLHRLLPNGAPPLARPLLGVAVDPVNFYAFVWCARHVSVWDCVTGVRVAMITDNATRVVDVAVDGEERLVFCLLADKSVNVFSSRSWKLVGKAEDGHDMFRPVYDTLTTLFYWKERRLLMSGCSVPFAWRRRLLSDGGGGDGDHKNDSSKMEKEKEENVKRKKRENGGDNLTGTEIKNSNGNNNNGPEGIILPQLLTSHSGGHLVAVGPERVNVYSARDGEEFNCWYHDAADVCTAAAIDPDGLRLVVGTESNKLIFMNYAKGYSSVQLGHNEETFDGVVAIAVSPGGDVSLRIVCAALRRKLLVWVRDTQLFHHIAAPDAVFVLPEAVEGSFVCLAVVHQRRHIFAAGTSAGRIILFSEHLSVLNHFDMSRTPLRNVQSIVPCDANHGLFCAVGVNGNAP